MSAHERLKWARESADFVSAAEAARAMGVSEATYSGHENGSRGIKASAATRYASFFKVSLEWLLANRGEPRSIRNITTVVGYIATGAQVFLRMDGEPGSGGLEYVELPPGVDIPCVCAKIADDSMYPWEKGWLVFWARDQEPGVPENCLGKICVVKLMDGRMFVKRIQLGNAGLFTLESWNAPPWYDAEVLWATRVVSVTPV